MYNKTFLFFDCECANCYEGVGKICSFGYVLTDSEFNIIESEDVIINPETEFDWYLLSPKNSCHLAYSKDYFRIKPNFASYYKGIKKLLTTGDRYIAGFSVGNDIGFVNSACERYSLPYIQFRAIDLENLLNREFGCKKKLSEWIEFMKYDTSDLQTHKSVDDAKMTMYCLKYLAEKKGKSGEEIIKENEDLFISNEQIIKLAEERKYKKEVLEKIKKLYGKKKPQVQKNIFNGTKFEIDGKFLRKVDDAYEIVKLIYDYGGIISEHISNKGYVVFENENVPEGLKTKIQKRGLELISIDCVKSKCSC